MARRAKRDIKPEEPGDEAPIEQAEPAKPEEPADPAGNRAKVIKNLLAAVEEKMRKDTGKTTVGDYIRLVQLQKELDEGEPKEIKVTWVESETKGNE